MPSRPHKGAFGLLVKAADMVVRLPHLTADRILKDGDAIGGFTVIAVPGHTAGSIALWRPRDRVLISGDALLTDRNGDEVGPRKRLAADYDLAVQSAAALRRLGYRYLLAGHGRPRAAPP